MRNLDKTREDWKSDGDKLCEKLKFYRAILCYDEALRLTFNEADALDLFLDRCYSRINCQHFDSALDDAELVLGCSPTDERALLYQARAIYGLRRFKESADQLAKVMKIYPENREARLDFQRCLARLREQKGHFDFAAMLDEAVAKSPKLEMDRADHFGPIEARNCAIESQGRGIFSTKPIKAGQLLLVEKAFHCCLAPPSGKVSGSRSSLPSGILTKLHHNPSLAPAFAGLYPGPDFEHKFDEGNVRIDEDFVWARVDCNSFAVPILSATWQWRATNKCSSLKNSKLDTSGAVGIWVSGSMANHSCHPSISRYFIGDMMIWRANFDIPANTELTIGYNSSYGDYADRQEFVASYGFVCECVLCLSQQNTPCQKMTERHAKTHEMLKCFERSKPTNINIFFRLIEEIEATYVFPPSRDPRLHLSVLIAKLVINCKRSMQHHVLKLSHMFLKSLGFEVDVMRAHWKIKVWGFMGPEVVQVLADLLRVCTAFNTELCEGLYEDLKTAYTIMTGEAESLGWYYGQSKMARLDELLKDKDEKITEKKKELREMVAKRDNEITEKKRKMEAILKEKEELMERLKEKENEVNAKEEELKEMLAKNAHVMERGGELEDMLEEREEVLKEHEQELNETFKAKDNVITENQEQNGKREEIAKA